MGAEKTSAEELVSRLNAALGWEMRAQTLYAHYAAYVKGIYRLHLKPYFEGEAAESVVHAGTVRDQIAKLGGIAITDRDATEIVHTTDYKVMLREAHKTETHAAKSYRAFLDLAGIDAELFDAIEQIYFQEERSVEELNQLLDS
jgi:bacterioferritin (cytochrome b1)